MTAKLQGGVVTKELFRCTRDGNRIEDISSSFVGGSVKYREDLGGGMPMVFTMQLLGPQVVSDLEDFVSPYITITYDDGTVLGPKRLGLFVVGQPDVTLTRTTAVQQYPCEDLTAIVRDSVFDAAFKVPSGTKIVDAIGDILDDAGIVNYRLPNSTKTTGYKRTFLRGMSNLEAANSLCQAAGWFPLWMDLQGVLTTQPIKLLSETQPIATITDADCIGEVRHKPTRGQVGNIVKVRFERSDQPTLYAVRRNTDVESPISIPNVGREIAYGGMDWIDVPDAETQDDVDAYADHLIEVAKSYERTVSLQVMPNFDLLRQHAIIECDIETAGWDAYGRFWIRSWTQGFMPSDVLPALELNRVVRFQRGEDVS